MNKIKFCVSHSSLVILMTVPLSTSYAEVAGNVGKIRVHGALVESACQLEMTSADQSIDLGTIQTADFKSIGDKAKAIPFEILLQDCISTNTSMTNFKTATEYWSTDQPAFKIRFLAQSAQGFPNLISVNGAKGIGLQISEENGTPIALGTNSHPLFITPPQEIFKYWITPIKIATLEPNAFQSIISFELIYE
ncbi:fimbrial protein [Acinetobacter sp. ANC 4558]|uniref:fimbrial protein n=1 Tax=Acinetobacter sp. ANC 4558 TaxID=1977876 RepID=UPI00148A8D4D|nr:fimbrial protein [Acinetobacter sp. ANC 4558]